jgi:hypothetical protein
MKVLANEIAFSKTRFRFHGLALSIVLLLWLAILFTPKKQNPANLSIGGVRFQEFLNLRARTPALRFTFRNEHRDGLISVFKVHIHVFASVVDRFVSFNIALITTQI